MLDRNVAFSTSAVAATACKEHCPLQLFRLVVVVVVVEVRVVVVVVVGLFLSLSEQKK